MLPLVFQATVGSSCWVDEVVEVVARRPPLMILSGWCVQTGGGACAM